MSPRTPTRVAQAWVTPVTEDPAAVSARTVARAHLPAGRRLTGLHRRRLFEVKGALPDRAAVEDLLHRSTQFYNPHKERCVVRWEPDDPVPVEPGEAALLVWDRGEERRPAAERWWRHEVGRAVEVREGVVWTMAFEEDGDASASAADLAELRDRAHGLLCNPHSQEGRLAGGPIPLPWIGGRTPRTARGRT